MTQVSRKGFVDKNGQKVVIVPNVPGATEGNLASFDENGNLQDSGKKPADFAPVVHTHDSLMSEDQISINARYAGHQSATVMCDSEDDANPYVLIGLTDESSKPFINKDAYINFDSIDNLNRALEDPVKSTDTTPTYDDSKLITAGGVKQNFADKNHSHSNIRADVEWGQGQVLIDEDDNGCPMVSFKLKDISDPSEPRIEEASISINNIVNLRCTLLGLSISFIRDENGDYTISESQKEDLNNLISVIPADKCVPCVVHAQWWNGNSYVGGYFPGSLCRHTFVRTKIYNTIYLSFLGNLFYTERTNTSDFPNTWTKFENPFATVSADDDSGINGNNSAEDDQPSNDGLDG